MRKTTPTIAHRFGSSTATMAASTRASSAWVADTTMSSFRRSKVSASIPPTIEKNSIGPSWANSTTPTNVDERVRS
jgi:hypothetical protein